MSNIKETIRQEIERRIKLYSITNEEEQWIVNTYWSVLSFIDSLPEEKPSDDLEEAAEEYADKHGFRVPYDGSNNYYDDVDVKASKEGFIAGAEWMAKQGVTFTAAVDHYEDFYLDSYDQEAEAIKKTWSKSDGLGNSSNTKEMNEIKQTSLKEAAEEYAYRGIPDEIKQSVKPIADEIIKQFIAGAEWQKKQQ